MTKVLSVGGSIIVPENPDTEFLTNFVNMVTEWLNADKSRKLILVAGADAQHANAWSHSPNESSVWCCEYYGHLATPNGNCSKWYIKCM